MEAWRTLRTEEQNRLLQPACRDLAQQLSWFGTKLTQDEWRWLICASILRVKIVPGINRGDGAPGIVTLGGSSRKLTKEQATEAIELAFSIGDAPWTYDPSQNEQVKWCEAIVKARWLTNEE